MIPVKDNIPRERFPLVTVIAVVVVVIAYLLSSDHRGLLPLLVDILFLGLLGPSVEGALGRVRFASLCVLVGLSTLAVRSLAGFGSPSAVLLGALVVTATVLGGYLLLFPHARVLSLVPIPFYTTLVEVPAALLIGLWLALQVCFDAAGLA
ncbi:MAG TPA: rhomboid family intramembrane serine protease [Solirubrobacteraceae bacterium]|jgi:membrane associated rhomboid family serine protease|nr:rhomboid family intramembrane serine protease [Solirubrobacteraceae bacterium]